MSAGENGKSVGASHFDLEKTFRLTAEISSVALLIGFVASAAINQLVFNSWGLNFVSYATPSDVVMSGIGFLLDTAFPFVFALVTLIGPAVLGQKYSNDRIKSLALLIAVAIIAIWLSQFLQGIAERAVNDRKAFAATRFSDAYLLTVLVLALSVSLPIVLHYRSNGAVWRRKVALIAVPLVAVVLSGLSLVNIVKLRAELGYQRTLTEVLASADQRCTSDQPIVLWVGSEWTVAQCVGGKPFALRSDAAGEIVPSDAVGMCDPFGFLTLWECNVRTANERNATSEPS